jgi:hypothetical protein
MNLKIKVITNWVQTANGKEFDLARLLGAGDSCMDITGEVTPVDSPVVVEVWGTDATLARIEADASHYVITVEEIINEQIP